MRLMILLLILLISYLIGINHEYKAEIIRLNHTVRVYCIPWVSLDDILPYK